MRAPITQRLIEANILRFGLIPFLALILAQAIAYFAGLTETVRRVLVDFDAFYIVGQMFWEGTLNSAYSADELFEAQRRLSGTDSFMPWSYPPQFNSIAAGLALMPRGTHAQAAKEAPAFAQLVGEKKLPPLAGSNGRSTRKAPRAQSSARNA